MASMHRFPPDTNEKEKIVGGVLTLGQAGLVAVGPIIGIIVFGCTYPFIKMWSILFVFPCLFLGLPLVIYKKEKLPLLTYLKYKRRFNKKPKQYPNLQTVNNDLDFTEESEVNDYVL